MLWVAFLMTDGLLQALSPLMMQVSHLRQKTTGMETLHNRASAGLSEDESQIFRSAMCGKIFARLQNDLTLES